MSALKPDLKFDPPVRRPMTYEEQIIATKLRRIGLDAELQKLKDMTVSRSRALAITKIQEAIMWLGMDLKEMNAPDPYPDSLKANANVAPTADGLKM